MLEVSPPLPSAMELNTILNRSHRFRGFVYQHPYLSADKKKAACDRIYTFNVRHFQQLAPDLADRIGAP